MAVTRAEHWCRASSNSLNGNSLKYIGIKYRWQCITLGSEIMEEHNSRIGVSAIQHQYNFKCECGKNFTYKKHFDAHRRKIHNDPKSYLLKDIYRNKFCPLCDFSAKLRNEMIKHYEVIHKISFVEEKYTFASQPEFLLWKRKIESETRSKYINKGTQVCPNRKVTSFYCHRSGHYVTKGKGLRSLKRKGSNKINGFCPARIVQKCFNDNNGTCVIYFYSTHVGHQNELKYLTFTHAEKEEVAKKIALKIPFDDILDQVRDSIHNSSVGRIHLLTRKDLHNIQSAYNLQSKAVRHKDDITSTRPREMEKQDHSEGNIDSLEIVNSNSESEICELSKYKHLYQDLNTRKEKLKNSILATLSTISSVEEVEAVEEIIAQLGPCLAVIRDKHLKSLQRQQNLVGHCTSTETEK
ncbi:uncharacterized protein LOC132699405 isoform X2 [Cylas formicarius]|uniref:uncharacterized protein LOC132699405 isoform X2 n=1 Tax=Cylas formicarius TaxID=197179 RepID=UPI0029587C7E|nr:uncharacterized protein LOC132699405 isoform X2 [Cylas formicarius]